MALHHDLAVLASTVSVRDIGAQAQRALVNTLIDTVGCAVASAPEEFADGTVRTVGAAMGQGTCSIVGRSERLSPAGAALVNATLGHGYDFDDVHMPSIAHFSTIVIPAALAACEMLNADGKTFLDAILAGDEVGGRLGWATCSADWGGSAIRARGFFPTAILGTIAAAVAVARVARLSCEQTAQAISIASSHAAGLAAISRGDNSTKRTQAGWAAQAGMLSALLAREGFTGIESVLETPQGFVAGFCGGNFIPDRLRRGQDAPWICEEMSFKYYPVEYIIQPMVELANAARQAIGAARSSISSIETSASSRFVTLFEPKPAKIRPADRFLALMSAPHCIARALTKAGDGTLRLSDFRENYRLDEETVELASRVRFVADASLDAAFPVRVGAKLRVLAGVETLWSGGVEDVFGSPSRPMGEDDLHAKFFANVGAVGGLDGARMLDTLLNIQAEPDARWIGSLRSERPA